jgi:WD repeat and SOF domain-containing protein 1
VDAPHSRDVYHTKRMQRVFCVRVTGDARFVLSGSDDANVRVWKARASEPIRVLSRREKVSLEYKDALKKRFAQAPEIRRIATFHRVPKILLSKRRRINKQRVSRKRRMQNAAKHSKPGTIKFKTRALEPIVTEQD